MVELHEWEDTGREAGIETVLLASPVTPDGRLAELCERSRGFVYGVNLLGVTGERTSVSERSTELARRMKAVTDRPVVMGFGISTPAQAAEVAAAADGVVMASALMRLRLDGGGPEDLGAKVAEVRAALDA
jgi:tryptophan synthase alpha chain